MSAHTPFVRFTKEWWCRELEKSLSDREAAVARVRDIERFRLMIEYQWPSAPHWSRKGVRP